MILFFNLKIKLIKRLYTNYFNTVELGKKKILFKIYILKLKHFKFNLRFLENLVNIKRENLVVLGHTKKFESRLEPLL